MPAGQEWGLTLREVTRQFSGLWIVEGVPEGCALKGLSVAPALGLSFCYPHTCCVIRHTPQGSCPQHIESERLRLVEAPSKLISLEKGQPEGCSLSRAQGPELLGHGCSVGILPSLEPLPAAVVLPPHLQEFCPFKPRGAEPSSVVKAAVLKGQLGSSESQSFLHL